MSRSQDRWVVWKDVRFLIEISLGYLITAVCPPRWDPWFVDRWVNSYAPPNGERVKDLAGLMRALLGPAADQRNMQEMAARHFRTVIEGRWGRMRSLHNWAWRPEVIVE